MDLVILAGAVGEDALWTRGCPRPLLPLAGTTLLERLLTEFDGTTTGARALCANGHTDVIARHLADPNARRGLMIVEDRVPRGTAGCLKACEPLTQADTIVLIGGSVWLEDDPAWLLERHRTVGNALTVFCTSDPPGHGAGFSRGLRPAGVYCCKRSALDYIRPTGYQDLKEQWVPALQRAGLRVGAVTLRGTSCEVTDWSSYMQAVARSLSDERLAARNYHRLAPDIWCGQDVEIAPKARIVGPALLGHGCKIEDGAVIVGPAVLGDGSHVGRNSWLVRVVAPEGVRLAPGASVTDRLIPHRCDAPAAGAPAEALVRESVLARAHAGIRSRENEGRKGFLQLRVRDENLAPALWDRRPWRSVGLSVLTTTFMATFWSTLAGLWEQLSNNADYSAGLLVPVAAAYMAATRRRRLAALAPAFWGVGVIVLLTGVAVNIGGASLQDPFLEQLGMLACANGLVMTVAGRKAYRVLWYPLAFLTLMLPLPPHVYPSVMLPLQELTAMVSATFLETLGVPAELSGSVISIAGHASTAVIEAGGGLRMVLALLIVIGVVAFIINRPRWQKVTVVVSSVPIAIACNALRIVAGGYCHSLRFEALAQGILQGGAGLFMMPAALSLIALECWLLANLVTPRQAIAALLVDRVENHEIASDR